MTTLGLKHQLVGAERWPRLRIYGRPTKMPRVPQGHQVVCGLRHGTF